MSPSSGVPVDQNDRLPVAVVLVVDLDVVVVLCTDFDVRHLCSFLSSWSGRLNRPGAAVSTHRRVRRLAARIPQAAERAYAPGALLTTGRGDRRARKAAAN